jgi:hypothetical protein
MTTVDLVEGGYAFAPGVFQYSAGVRALPGSRIERVRFTRVVPLQKGFARIAELLRGAGRPFSAFCACELRSPAPFTEDGFRAFNQAYATVLGAWGLLATGANPVARSNVCPEIDPPAEPGFHAFCYAVPDADAAPSFVVAGSGEVPEGKTSYREHVVAPGDTSPNGMRAKARFVLAEMERRMAVLGADWSATTGAQAYTVFEMQGFLADEVVHRSAMAHGLTWHFARPPIVGLDFEMDCRRVMVERVVEV